MNDWDLRIFEAVARTGGIGRAAAELNTVQSNVTSRMRRLEEELESDLFDRHSRGVTLTPAGRRLRPYAIHILGLLQEARRAAKDDGVPRGALSIGSMETTAALRLPPVLSAYTKAYPEVELKITTGTTSGLIDDVLRHRLEGAFVTGPVAHPELASQVIFREELVLVTARGVSCIEELKGSGDLRIVVFRAGCAYRQRLEAVVGRRGLVGFRLLEFGSLEAILGCVSAGIGITLLPEAVVKPMLEERNLRLHYLPPAEANAETVFVQRAGSHGTSAMSEFIRMAAGNSVRQGRGTFMEAA